MNTPDPTPRKRPARKVWVFSELNHDLKPEDLARVLVAAGIERARRDSVARRAAILKEIDDAE